jgi:hypothetical protein
VSAYLVSRSNKKPAVLARQRVFGVSARLPVVVAAAALIVLLAALLAALLSTLLAVLLSTLLAALLPALALLLAGLLATLLLILLVGVLLALGTILVVRHDVFPFEKTLHRGNQRGTLPVPEAHNDFGNPAFLARSRCKGFEIIGEVYETNDIRRRLGAFPGRSRLCRARRQARP